MLAHTSDEKYTLRLSHEELKAVAQENLEAKIHVGNVPTEKKIFFSYDHRQKEFLKLHPGTDGIRICINDFAWRLLHNNYHWKGNVDDTQYEFFIRGYMDKYRQ